MAQITAVQRLAQITIGRKPRGAPRTLRRMRFDIARMASIELIVDQRMQQDFSFVAGHGLLSSASQAVRNNARARASRDITVPTGTPSDVGDLAIAQIVYLAQHDRLPERIRQLPDQLLHGFAIEPVQGFRLRRWPRFVPEPIGGLLRLVEAIRKYTGEHATTGIFGTADIAQDRQ